jgi:predicted AlkP superfamily phosphohydrolase/phosphomutase/tetratricopeptide (TPR) repeat protein
MPDSAKRRVLLVGWDGADWKIIHPLLDRGEMPNLHRLINAGVMGNLSTLRPTYSPLIWNSIATGKLPDKHGIIGFTEVDEAAHEVRAATSLSRKAKAVWNILSQKGLKTHVINWFAGHPAEPINGVCVSEMLARTAAQSKEPTPAFPAGVIHPAALSSKITEFLVRPQDIDSQTIALFVPDFKKVDQTNDHRLEIIACQLAECLTVHAAATWAIEHEAWDFAAVYYGAIDHFCHAFMRYHPPRLPWVNEPEQELYRDVVNSAYRLQDLLLGRLLHLAGGETAVIICSDHGWHAGEQRLMAPPSIAAGPAEEHRPIGVLAIKGPGIKQDELVHGANVLDLAPTVLTLLGVPVGRDMDGRVLAEAFEATPAVEAIPSWEEVPGPAGMHPKGATISRNDSQALIDQFVALGYIEAPRPGDQTAFAEMTRQENLWTLARVYFYSRRFLMALPLLEEVYDRSPLRLDMGVLLAECQFMLGLKKEAYELLRNLSEAFPGDARARMLLGLAEQHCGRPEAALAHLEAVDQAGLRRPHVLVYLGRVYFHLGRHQDAQRAFERALELDPDSALAHLGVARCLLRSRSYEPAAEAAMRAIGLEFSLGDAHLCLGKALARIGRTQRAVEALETAVRYLPPRPEIHADLAALYLRTPDGNEKAVEHSRLRLECLRLRAEARERVRALREEVRARELARGARSEEESRQLMEAVAALPASPASAAPTPRWGAAGSSGKEFLIVSGLPRSGTSLMMQMLAAGGVPIMADGARKANEDNPEGYYEWEPIRRLRHSPRVIEQTEGKAVKVVSLLLAALPRIHSYKVIFMWRPPEEVAASQAAMLERMGKPAPNRDRLLAVLRRHQDGILRTMPRLRHFKFLVVDYPDVLADPAKTVKQLQGFLGPSWIKTPDAMAAAVKPNLYHQRSTPAEGRQA